MTRTILLTAYIPLFLRNSFSNEKVNPTVATQTITLMESRWRCRLLSSCNDPEHLGLGSSYQAELKAAPAGIRTRVADSKGRHTLDTLGLTGLYALADSILPGLVGATEVRN